MAYYYNYTRCRTRGCAEYYLSQAEKYIDKAPRQGQYYISSAAALLDRRVNEAVSILEQAVKEFPDDKNALLRLGMTFYTQEQYETSVEYLQKAIALDSTFVGAYNQLIYSADRADMYEVAVWAADRYAEIAPDQPNPYDSRGDLLARNGRVDESIAAYRTALEKRPTFYASLENLGLMYLFSRDFDKADSCFRAMPEEAGQYRLLYSVLYRAATDLYNGRLNAALKLLGAGPDSMSVDSAFRNFWPNRFMQATIYREQGNLTRMVEEMITCRSILLAQPGTDSLAYLDFYVQALAESGQLDSARQMVDFAEAYHERTGLGRGTLNYAKGMMDFVEGRYDSAVARFEVAAALMKDFASHMMLGRSYLEANRLDRAVDTFTQITSCFTRSRAFYAIWDVKTHYFLGLAYEKSGWVEKAIEHYDIFLSYWQNADEGLKTVNDARERVARLKAGNT
jgi:tetratricopeptide (TPR) repeat protein